MSTPIEEVNTVSMIVDRLRSISNRIQKNVEWLGNAEELVHGIYDSLYGDTPSKEHTTKIVSNEVVGLELRGAHDEIRSIFDEIDHSLSVEDESLDIQISALINLRRKLLGT